MTAELFFTPTSTRTAITFARLHSIIDSSSSRAPTAHRSSVDGVGVRYSAALHQSLTSSDIPHRTDLSTNQTLLLRFPHPNSLPLLQSAYVGSGWHPHRATPIVAGIGTAVVRLGCTVAIRADVGVDCGAVHLRSLAERAEGRVLLGGRDGKGRCLINVSDAKWKDAKVVTVAKESVKCWSWMRQSWPLLPLLPDPHVPLPDEW